MRNLTAPAAAGLLIFMCAFGLPAQKAATQANERSTTLKQDMETAVYRIEHVRVRTERSFAEVVRSLEEATGVFDASRMKALAEAGLSAAASAEAIDAMAGPSGFMRFAEWDHGAALRLTGHKEADAIRFAIGNPTIAVRMTSRSVSSALYAPLSLLIVGEERGGTRIEFDRPSTLFAQFDDPQIVETAHELDRKLDALVHTIAGKPTPRVP